MIYVAVFALAFYLIFIVFPALVAGTMVFLPKKSLCFDRVSVKGTYYEKYYEAIEESGRFFDKLPCKELSTVGYDGAVLHSDYYENGNSDKAVIFFHGYRATPRFNFSHQAKLFYELGYNIAFVCQRSHGASDGKRIGLGAIEKHDVISWCDHYKNNTGNRFAILYGVSMGCTSVALASDKLDAAFVRGLILDCGYTSVYEQIKRESIHRHLPARFLMPYICLVARIMLKEDIKDKTTEHLPLCSVPKLFIHGTADDVVPYSETKKAYDLCRGEKDILLVENAEHTAAVLLGGAAADNKLVKFSDYIFKGEI